MNAGGDDRWRVRALRLKKLVAASQALASVEEADDLLPLLLGMAQEAAEAAASSILLYDPVQKVLKFSLAMNEDRTVQESLQRVELKLGEGIGGWVAQHKKPVIVGDASADCRFFNKADEITGYKTKAMACVPILNNEELLGVVQVLNPRNRNCFDEHDLELLESFAYLAGVALVRRRLLAIRLREQRMRSQFDTAARIQSHFLPVNPEPLPHCRIWGHTRPAVFVGGDSYDFIAMDDGSWMVCVADVAGKGLAAAMVMTALWARLRSRARSDRSVSDILADLNRDLYDVLNGEVFVTAVLTRFWPDTGRVDVGLAGHVPPIRASSFGIDEIDQPTGMPLGIDPDGEYVGCSTVLGENESLVMVTDGITEARRGDGRFFGEERLYDFFVRTGGPPFGRALLKTVDSWRSGIEANDDTTVVEIWRPQTA